MSIIFKKKHTILARKLVGILPILYPLHIIFSNFNIFRGINKYIKDYMKYKSSEENQDSFPLKLAQIMPYIYDVFQEAGHIPKHYFYQDLWAARKVYKSGVGIHYDIGSRLDGFIAHCLIFCEVVLIDIRTLQLQVNNLKFIEGDGCDMPKIKSNSIYSISSLHAVEHFGLGRYGDLIEPNAYITAINEIMRVTKYQGNIYFSVPIGKQKLEFNAHRIFSPSYVVNLFNKCSLVEFSVITDDTFFYENVDLKLYENSSYACGLYHFVKCES